MAAMDGFWLWLTAVVVAYLLGSVPFGLLLGLARGIDIRTRGSGNVGASNLGRQLGKAWGLGCFALDVAKGLVPVLGYGLVSGLVGGTAHGVWPTLGWLGVAAAAMAGHVLPPWLGFRGGKGVATGLGGVLGLYPMLTAAGVVAGLLWLAVTWTTGYISLGSIIAALAMPVLALLAGLMLAQPVGEIVVLVVATLALGLVVVIRHTSNIARLRAGTEGRVSWARRGARRPDETSE